MERRYSAEDEAFFRKMIQPEEERERFAKWDGSFRWFRSDNIVCLEHYLRRKQTSPDEVDRAQGA
jgi:hypothetical protein